MDRLSSGKITGGLSLTPGIAYTQTVMFEYFTKGNWANATLPASYGLHV